MSSKTPAPTITPTRVDLRRTAIVSFYVLTVMSAISEAADFSLGVTTALKMYAASAAMTWLLIDARRRGRPILWGVQLVALITYPVSWVVYLLATRGWRGAGWIVVNVIVTLLAFYTAWYGMLAIYGRPLLI